MTPTKEEFLTAVETLCGMFEFSGETTGEIMAVAEAEYPNSFHHINDEIVAHVPEEKWVIIPSLQEKLIMIKTIDDDLSVDYA